MSPLPFQLGAILRDMNQAIELKLYYPGLLVALTIPEICSALALHKNVFVKQKHYTKFIDDYTKPAELGVNGLDCYRLRGGLVHRANFAGHPKFGATHVVFTTPETVAKMHGFSLVDDEKIAAMFDIVMFCDAMKIAVQKWYEDNKNNTLVKENLKYLIHARPNGISPFVPGNYVLASGA